MPCSDAYSDMCCLRCGALPRTSHKPCMCSECMATRRAVLQGHTTLISPDRANFFHPSCGENVDALQGNGSRADVNDGAVVNDGTDCELNQTITFRLYLGSVEASDLPARRPAARRAVRQHRRRHSRDPPFGCRYQSSVGTKQCCHEAVLARRSVGTCGVGTNTTRWVDTW